VTQHRLGLADGFTKKYRLHRLVYYETTSDVSRRAGTGEADQALATREEDCAGASGESEVA
jgi:predicted GIY-YIG superfamily endonuclease